MDCSEKMNPALFNQPSVDSLDNLESYLSSPSSLKSYVSSASKQIKK
jgi:hypothetical protein